MLLQITIDRISLWLEGEHAEQRPGVHGGDVLLRGHPAAAAEDRDDLEVVPLGGVTRSTTLECHSTVNI